MDVVSEPGRQRGVGVHEPGSSVGVRTDPRGARLVDLDPAATGVSQADQRGPHLRRSPAAA